MASHQASQLRDIPAPTVKRLLRGAGWNMATVARIKPSRHRSLVARVVKKQIVSDRVWERIAWCLNNPKKNGVA